MDDVGADGYWLTRWCFQRSLAVVYLIGFVAAVNQFRPLLGERGLLPVPLFLQRVGFWDAPSLFFLHYSDRTAGVLAWAGIFLSLVAVTGFSERFGTPASATLWALLWGLYLSFVNVGQTFYAFGWESLLLETGFLAVFLGARHVAPPAIMMWLLRWVLFRLILGAGLIKLRGDPCWRDLTCLVYYYETQPIPNPLSWYFHQLPAPVHKAGVLFNHFVELIVPFGYLTPIASVRYVAGGFTILFQVILILSGNLSWLNYLTIVLAFSCFDDRLLSRLVPIRPAAMDPRARAHEVAVVALTLLVAVLSIQPTRNMLSPEQVMQASFNPFQLVNTYGAFGSVSQRRMEVILEGTDDETVTPSTQWKEYEFKVKPGSPKRRPAVLSPYHLRLDWLMWFAALSPYYGEPWILHLVAKLLEGDRATLGLLVNNPFPDRPPRFLRAQLYGYRFTNAEEKRRTGQWWSRTLVSEYLPPLSLSDPRFVEALRRHGWEDAVLR